MKRAGLFFSAIFALACADRHASSPLAPSAEEPSSAVRAASREASGAAVFTFVAGDSDLPVVGATVLLGGTSFTTDAEGKVDVSSPITATTPLEVTAAGFLRRETLMRADTRFTLWPDREGFDAGFTREALYFPGFVIDAKLTRPKTGTMVSLILQGDAKDPAIVQAHQDAAALLTGATEGKVTYVLNDQATTGVLVKVMVNPAEPFFATVPGALAVTKSSTLGNEILGAEIIYKEASAAGVRNLAAHELGHTFGLGHPTPRGIMNAAVDTGLPDYSDAEKLAIRMSLQRRLANALPDNDRAVSGAGRERATISSGDGCTLRH